MLEQMFSMTTHRNRGEPKNVSPATYSEILNLKPSYNQATTKLALHSNETSKDKLSMI